MRFLHEASWEEAAEFLLRSKSYSNLELPDYFDFTEMLNACQEVIGFSKDESYVDRTKLDEKPNFDLMHNKNGRFDWRRFELIHPVLYVDLVRTITKPEHWARISDSFSKRFRNARVVCSSPIALSKETKSAAIQSCWAEHELHALRLSMKFRYFGETDLVDCYGTLYTHAIAWALNGKEKSKEVKWDKNELGNIIDRKLRAMRDNESIGIAQGSALMDFIAELVLGYVDEEIESELSGKSSIGDYKILRFRDDYRVFSNSRDEIEQIIKVISSKASIVGWRLNPLKTQINDDVVSAVIKRDKRESKSFEPEKGLLYELIALHEFSTIHSNSSVIMKRMIEVSKYIDDPATEVSFDRNPREALAIAIDICIHNPRAFAASIGLISRLITRIDKDVAFEILEDLKGKVEAMPNNEFVRIWLQRLLYPFAIPLDNSSAITNLVNNKNPDFWAADFIVSKKLLRALSTIDVIDRNALSEKSQVLGIEEFELSFEYS